MTLSRISRDNLEKFTMELRPSRTYISGSGPDFVGPATGTVKLFARRSPYDKEINRPGDLGDGSPFDESSEQSRFALIKSNVDVEDSTDRLQQLEEYMRQVNSASVLANQDVDVDIVRFRPDVRYSRLTAMKNTVRNLLFPYYRSEAPSAHWAFTNYNTLNFFTASSVPSNSAIMYPNSSSNATSQFASGTYVLSGAWTFDFYINPRYTIDEPDGEFHAGTLFHMSSSYAVSLVSGSSRDESGKTDRFRMKLQLSHSADVTPSTAPEQGTFPNDLVFLSDDNSLERNRWHHVSIRWGTETIDEGSGSFFIDGAQRGSFVVPSASLALAPIVTNPSVLFLGNFFEGSSLAGNPEDLFFTEDVSQREGLLKLIDAGSGVTEPSVFSLDHPLNAEVHDLKIFNRFLTNNEIAELGVTGPTSLGDGLVFYVPPFFTRESPRREQVGSQGGVMQTPFFTVDSRTDDPFNVALSFGVDGHDINLENFTRDMANGIYPRLFNLTASQITVTSEEKTANEFLFHTASVRKRNVTILPCDNGKFKPNFALLKSGTISMTPITGTAVDHFINDCGILDLSLVSLNDLVPTSSLQDGLFEQRLFVTSEQDRELRRIIELNPDAPSSLELQEQLDTELSGNILNDIEGATPENPGVDPGSVLTVFQRTRDNSSNEVVFFDISNLFYGNEIEPGTFVITDPQVTGTDDKVKVTLRDDGFGNLYRGDAKGPHPTWASVGNILYPEGIVVVKTPVIPFFGKKRFETSFDGSQDVHVMKVSVIAPAGAVNSSSNPGYQKLSASFNANDPESEFVYVSSVLFHDDNLNVVMRSNLAQPIVKRTGDKFKVISKIDF